MSVGAAWAADPDNDNRDPNNLNDHLKVNRILLYLAGTGLYCM